MFGDLKGIFAQAQIIQEQFAALQKRLATERVYGESGAGLVRIEFSGDSKARKIDIDASIADDTEVLTELLTAAINDGLVQIEHKKRAQFEQLAKEHNLPTHMFPF